MTCIVGFIEKNTVYIGGDSAGSTSSLVIRRHDSKVFKNAAHFSPSVQDPFNSQGS